MGMRRGFTLIELVVMIGIVAILAVAAIPRFADRQTFDARSFVDQAASMVRYGQKMAIAQQRNVFVRLNGASIALCFDSGCTAGNRVPPPSSRGTGSAACGSDTTWFCEAPKSPVSYSVSPFVTIFYFDATGKPFDTTGTALAAPFTVTVNGGGSLARKSFVVERETGYVHFF